MINGSTGARPATSTRYPLIGEFFCVFFCFCFCFFLFLLFFYARDVSQLLSHVVASRVG